MASACDLLSLPNAQTDARTSQCLQVRVLKDSNVALHVTETPEPRVGVRAAGPVEALSRT